MRLSRIKEILKAKSFKDFSKFMEGQTIELLKDGDSDIYEDDFMRWFNKSGVVD
jgi:hypothetical protein